MASRSYGPAVSKAEVLQANHREYDRGVDPLLVLAVYQPVHGGWQFTNIGGRLVLDHLAERLGPDSEVLELCSGLADTCRYLVTHSGCSITGIELNHEQVEVARSRIEPDPVLSRRIRLIEGDILTWTPDRLFDAVFAIDSLMMLPDVEAALAAAHRALRPAGSLSFAEIMAGPHITAQAREYAWDEGAIVSLPSPDEYTRMLTRAGFTSIRIRDLADTAIACFQKIHAAVEERRDELVKLAGTEGLQKWLDLASAYGGLFQRRCFMYCLVTAVREGEGPRG